MAGTPAGFRLRRTVPYRRRVDGTRYAITINDMRDEPPSAVVGVTDDAGWERHTLAVGDVLAVGAERWRVSGLTPGERGTVEFVPASQEAP